MKLYELLFLFKRQREKSKKANPQSIRYISTAYNIVINKLKERLKLRDNVTKKHIMSLDITDNMRDKLIKMLSAKLTATEKQHIKQSLLLDDLTNIIGIGRTKAHELIKMGLTDIRQLSQKKFMDTLPDSIAMLIKYKPVKLIPHAAIKKIELNLIGFKGAKLVGGFLRKKKFSKDIDVMLVSNSTSVLQDYIKYLKTQFPVHVYAHGTDKASLLIQVGKHYYKIDVFRTPTKTQHSMLLYSTGSKDFNVRMRGIAKRKGYLLNQNGLFKNGKLIPVKSEKDFFKILGLQYVPPHLR